MPKQNFQPENENNVPEEATKQQSEVKKEPQKQNNGIPRVNSKEELEALRKSLTADNLKNPDHVAQNRELFRQVSGEFNKAHPREKKKTPKIEKKPRKELSPEVKAKREEERKNRQAAIQNQRNWDAQIHEEDEKQQQQNLEYIRQMQSQWDAEDRGIPQQEKKNPKTEVKEELETEVKEELETEVKEEPQKQIEQENEPIQQNEVQQNEPEKIEEQFSLGNPYGEPEQNEPNQQNGPENVNEVKQPVKEESQPISEIKEESKSQPETKEESKSQPEIKNPETPVKQTPTTTVPQQSTATVPQQSTATIPQQAMTPEQRAARIKELQENIAKLQTQMREMEKANPELAKMKTTQQQTVQQPYVQQPYMQQPYMQQPYMQQPYMQQPYMQQPYMQQPYMQQPYMQQPYMQQPYMQQPYMQQPYMQQPYAQQQNVQQQNMQGPGYKAFSPEQIHQRANGNQPLNAAPFHSAALNQLSRIKAPEPVTAAYKQFKKEADKFIKAHKKPLLSVPSNVKAVTASLTPLLTAGQKYFADVRKNALSKGGKVPAADFNNLKALVQLDTLHNMATHGVAADSREGLTARMNAKLYCAGLKPDGNNAIYDVNPGDYRPQLAQTYNNASFNSYMGTMRDAELQEVLAYPDADVYKDFQQHQMSRTSGIGTRNAVNYANPQYANPQYANPQYANPQYANPQYANPQYANARTAAGMTQSGFPQVREGTGAVQNAAGMTGKTLPTQQGSTWVQNSASKMVDANAYFSSIAGLSKKKLSFTREPKPISVNSLRSKMKPFVDSAKEYQREMAHHTSLTSKELKALSAANHVETLDSLAANGISPHSPAGVRAILASKVAFAKAGNDPKLLCDPKRMQQSMQKTFLDANFKKFVSSMDEKTVKAMMQDNGKGLNKKFNEYVKTANLKKQPNTAAKQNNKQQPTKKTAPAL